VQGNPGVPGSIPGGPAEPSFRKRLHAARVSFELDELDFKSFARISVLCEDQAY
jgi:hypothetical protein